MAPTLRVLTAAKMTAKDWMTIGQIAFFVVFSIAVFGVWAAFDFSCDQDLCDGAALPYTAGSAWLAIALGVVLMGVRNKGTPEQFLIQAVLFGGAVVLVQIVLNQLLT